MATKEDQDILRLLVQYVSRAFYEPKFTIIMDQLARNPVLKDDELAGRLGLQLKELTKLVTVLDKAGLVKTHRQNELKEGAQRSVGRQYYYIDYQHFCNVVKWRVAEMRKRIDDNLRNELGSKGYVCPQCGKSFSTLEADRLIDINLGTFVCDICRSELIDNENADATKGNQDRMQRFNFQMRFIREGLRKTEEMVLPAFDVVAWIKQHIQETAQQRSGEATAGDGLKIAGSTPGQHKDEGIAIEMATDKDEATRRRERQEAAEAKRQQNLLPSWHLKSTISGDLTALGIAESARNAEAAAVTTPSSNEDILRSLGAKTSQRTTEQSYLEIKQEDVKPVITQQQRDQDFYDQYYASLAASSQPTPILETGGSDFGEEEEDVKPSIEYLNSLNEYRKRSRSTEDVGFPNSNSGKKVVKLAYENPGAGPIIASATPMLEALVKERPLDTEDPSLQTRDPVVHVNGQPISFSAITEEHQELMTPEEYTTYFEVYQQLNP